MSKKVRKSRVNPAIHDFIVDKVGIHSRDIANLTAKKFGVTRNTINRYLDRLVAEGILHSEGQTRARVYRLRYFLDKTESFDVTPATEEHIVFRQYVEPHLEGASDNAIDICSYGVYEMVNNVRDHSTSQKCAITVKRNARRIEVYIRDYGVGIFKKIANECKLNDERESILELAKGKLTTDPAHHTGEGIFFTSRMCREFEIASGNLAYHHEMSDDNDILIQTDDLHDSINGTLVFLEIDANPNYTSVDIFRQYEEQSDGVGHFQKTHVPVKLALYGNEQLISRSQARRVLARFNKFTEVMLDFKDVPRVGPAFVDEIFRVFRRQNPDVKIIPIRMNDEVRETITRAMRNGDASGEPPDAPTAPAPSSS
jgi:anti-sigma regulatory factor (Ser/Thr protein kinase)